MGKLKGYSYTEMSKKKLDKMGLELCEELAGKITKNAIMERSLETLNKQGRVFLVKQKKEVHGVVFFALNDYKAEDFEILKDGKAKEKAVDAKYEDIKAYEMSFSCFTQDLANYEDLIREDLFEKLQEMISEMDNSKVKAFVWGENVLVDNNIGKSNYSSVSFGLCIGLCLGAALGQTVFDNLALGMSVGMCLGLAIGATNYSVGKKKTDKK